MDWLGIQTQGLQQRANGRQFRKTSHATQLITPQSLTAQLSEILLTGLFGRSKVQVSKEECQKVLDSHKMELSFFNRRL